MLRERFALSKFLESPILGKGLGFPTPSELTYHGHEHYLAKLELTLKKKIPYVYYIHNFPAYVAMTMGLLGLTAIALIAAGALRSIWYKWHNPVVFSTFMALASLGLFSFAGVQYSMPQFIFLLASLSAILSTPSIGYAFNSRSGLCEPAKAVGNADTCENNAASSC